MIAKFTFIPAVLLIASTALAQTPSASNVVPHDTDSAVISPLQYQGSIPTADGKIELPPLPAPGLTIWVSPNGNDTNEGSKDHPLQTLDAARDKIRTLRTQGGQPDGGITVEIMTGIYHIDHALELTPEDSGTETSPIIYTAAKGAMPTFDAGASVQNFTPVTDPDILNRLPTTARTSVVQSNLKAQGITDYGVFQPGGFASARGFYTHPELELFFNGEAMPLAGWPNAQENMGPIAHFGGLTPTVYGFTLLAPGTGTEKDRIHYSGDEPERWVGESDAWIYGYLDNEWSDTYEKISSIDTQQKTIILAPPVTNYGKHPLLAGDRYRVINALSELDSPGEWYLDRSSGILYFYPPSDPSKAVVEVSMMETPVVEMNGVSNVIFRGLTWINGRGDGIAVQGGDSCLFDGCKIRQFAGNAMTFDGGSNQGVLSCDLSMLGRGGIVMASGDRKTLTPSGDFVANCRIDHFSRIDHTYTPAVLAQGVGILISHNDIHDANSSALRIEGNDNLIEYNNVHDVVLESNDQGASDMWGDPTFQGDVFRYNYWHDIGRQAGWMTAGVRLDDYISGVEVYGNVFDSCCGGGFGAVQINQGTDNVIENNVFYNCDRAVSGGAASKEQWKALLQQDRIKSKMTDVNATSPPYSLRYPLMLRLGETSTTMVWNNVVFNCKKFTTGGVKDLKGNLITDKDPGFVNAAGGDFRLRRDSELWNRSNFDVIPFDKIGTYPDPNRLP